MIVKDLRKEFKTTAIVGSETHDGAFYQVRFENGRFYCTCPNHTKAGAECKHIIAFKEELEFRRTQRENGN